MRYLVVYEKGPTSYSAYSPDLPGCVAAGTTFEETRENMRGAIELHLAGSARGRTAIARGARSGRDRSRNRRGGVTKAGGQARMDSIIITSD
jgi:predicted RNase H-like HicB family nuclease